MRFTYARFKGYIGFNNGMGLQEVVIDFSKAYHKICIISGKNGSGKSTLLNSLSILPDSNSDYIPGIGAEKELHIIDEDNIYKILITAPITNSGSRATTKAFISKNGVELNPNGNVGSYKDTIFSEFELDPSYISLSKLSVNDRGLVGKSPAERKRFFSTIIDSLESYNNMNKVFSKKSNIFKSYINNLSAKIKGVGDEEALRSSMNNIESRLRDLNIRKSMLEKSNTEAESFIKIVDPDGLIQDRYQAIYNEISNANNTLKDIESRFEDTLNKINEKEDTLESSKNSLIKNIAKMESDVEISKNKLTDLLDKKEEDIHILDIKREKINNIKGDFNLDELRYVVDKLRTTIREQETIFRNYGIHNFDVSKDEFIYIFSNLKRIKNTIDVFKSNKSNDILQATCRYIIEDRDDIEKELTDLKIVLDSNNEKIKAIDIELQLNHTHLETMSILSSRPKNCKIDSCPLIENALSISKTKPDEKIEKLSIEKDSLLEENHNLEIKISWLSDLLLSIRDLKTIIVDIQSNNLLDKVPTSYVFRDTNELLRRLHDHNTFNEIESSDIYIERAEEIEDYRDNKETLIKLEADLKIYENKESLINELADEILSIETDLENITETCTSLNSSISFTMNIIMENKQKLSTIEALIDIKKQKDEIKNHKEVLFEEYKSMKSNLEKIKIYVDQINYNNEELSKINSEFGPVEEQRKIIEHSLISLSQYQEEFSMYQEKYDIVNKLKKYSSPSSEGIQTLFINTYMSKTLTLCNELLSMLFNGEYKLCKYVINSQEFRMPFIGNGMEVDDITSGSSSQVAMMGMIINFVLLFQASTKYNIVGLDELDEVLDTYNRLMYIQVLNRVIDILGLDQCIIISHSAEVDRNDMDVIQLAEYNESDCYGEGNIIFNYYDL